MVDFIHIISCRTARSFGMVRYFTGSPCKRGHFSERLVSTNACTACGLVHNKASYKGNRERIRAQQNEYFAKNREQVNAKALAWYHRNSETRENNVGHCRARRARKLGASPVWFGELDEFVIEEAGTLARLRSEIFGFPWHLDHMIPLKAKKACGLHCAANIQVVPGYINMSKRNRLVLTEPFEWMKW